VASLSQGRTAAAQCGLFTYKSVPVIFEPPCNISVISVLNKLTISCISFDVYSKCCHMCFLLIMNDLCHMLLYTLTRNASCYRVTTITCSYVKVQVCRARPCSAPSWPSVPIRPSLSLIARWRCLLRTGRRRRPVSRFCHRLAGTLNRTGDRWLRWAWAVRSYRPTIDITALSVYSSCNVLCYSNCRSVCITRYLAMKIYVKESYISTHS